MEKTTVKIDGMVCGMCESHINDVIRQNFGVKKVSSSRRKGETIIVSEEGIDEGKLRDTINATGYRVISVTRETTKKQRGVSGG